MLFSVLTGPGGCVTGVGIHFKPRESRVICSSVSCSFDRFLMSFLCDSIMLLQRIFPLFLLRSFLFRLKTVFCFLNLSFAFPLISKDSDHKRG